MDYLIYIGALITILGLLGLGYSIKVAFGIKREGAAGENVAARLRKLVAINMGAMAFATIGLAMVAVGVIL